jgi:hypothetical protein
MCRSIMYAFKSTNVSIICYFCVADNITNFVLIFLMLVGYIIDFVQIYFHNFLRYKNMVFIFF